MSESRPCCRDRSSPIGRTPFDRAIAFDYHDGLVDGLIRCSGCGREYRIRMIDRRIESSDSVEEREITDFELRPIPEGSVALFSDAMAPYQEPSLPNWVPTWRFPTDREQDLIDALVDRIYRQAGPIELVISSSNWPTEEILTLSPPASPQRMPEAAARSIIQ